MTEWTGPVLLVVALLAALLWAARRAHTLGRAHGARRTLSGAAGVLLLGAALVPPVATWAHADPRGHMVQHLLLGMYAPLLLVLAAPVTLLLRVAGPRVRRRAARMLHSRVLRVVGHPGTAAVLSAGGLWLLYRTELYALSLEQPAVHHLVNMHLLLAGYLFAWSVAGPDPAPRRPGTATRLVVLVLAAASHAWLAKLLYARAGELPPGTTQPVAAAEQAAVWMYYGGDLAEIGLLLALLLPWYRRRSRRSAVLLAERPTPSTPDAARVEPGRLTTTGGLVHGRWRLPHSHRQPGSGPDLNRRTPPKELPWPQSRP